MSTFTISEDPDEISSYMEFQQELHFLGRHITLFVKVKTINLQTKIQYFWKIIN